MEHWDTKTGMPNAAQGRYSRGCQRKDLSTVFYYEANRERLSLSGDIVKAHGGELKVETEEGSGTTFTVIIPYTKS